MKSSTLTAKTEQSLSVGSDTIRATIEIPKNLNLKPTVLFLHGAGPWDRHSVTYLAESLAINGLASLRFDFSGHGESTGSILGSSLSMRVEQALAAHKLMDQDKPIDIIGTSMGGHIALELLGQIPVANLVLFCPALYSHEAYKVPFGDAFSEILRRKDSFLDAKAVNKLAKFEGGLLHIIGGQDKIIPAGVTHMYRDHSNQCQKRLFLEIPDAEHALHAWFAKNLLYKDMVEKVLTAFLDRNKPNSAN